MGRDQIPAQTDGAENISIHAPRVGRDLCLYGERGYMTISIHAPRVGRDNIFALLAVVGRISIHAPRVGRDSARPCRLTAVVYFNPRAPCGARRCCDVTPATRDCISIHAPRVGRDHRNWYYISYNYNFNPRAPCGARPFVGQEMTASFLFQSTRPVWGATRLSGKR